MSLFDDVLRARFGGLLGDPVRPSAPPIAGKVPVPAGAPGVVKPLGNSFLERAGRGISEVVGGPRDARLSEAENDAAQKQAMLQAGLAMLAGSYNPNGNAPGFGQVLASGVMAGQGTGEALRERAYLRTTEDRLNQALSDPELLGMLSPQERRLASLMPPEQAMQFLMEKLKPQAPTILSKDAVAVDAQGNVIASNVQGPDPLEGLPSGLKARISTLPGGAAAYAQLPPQERLAVVEQYLRDEERTGAARAPRISLQQQLTEQTGEGITRIALGDFEKLQASAQDANASLSDLAVVDSLLENTPTGGVEELTMPLRRLAASLGVADADKLGRQEAIAGISNKLALLQKEGMTGPMSDRDIQFLQQQVPRLGNTVEGNRILIRVAQRVAERRVQLARLAEEYLATHDTLDNNWFRFKRQWIEQNPLDFSDIRGEPAPWR